LFTALRAIRALVSCTAVHGLLRISTTFGDISAPHSPISARMPARSVSAITTVQNASNGSSLPGCASSTVRPSSFSNTAAARAVISRTAGSTDK
jgi:hypothetical protein